MRVEAERSGNCEDTATPRTLGSLREGTGPLAGRREAAERAPWCLKRDGLAGRPPAGRCSVLGALGSRGQGSLVAAVAGEGRNREQRAKASGTHRLSLPRKVQVSPRLPDPRPPLISAV